jgi:hypothetical protein
MPSPPYDAPKTDQGIKKLPLDQDVIKRPTFQEVGLFITPQSLGTIVWILVQRQVDRFTSVSYIPLP